LKKLCIITPSLGKYSETFIQNQIKYLPFEKSVITTGTGEFATDNSSLAGKSLLAKMHRAFGRIVLNEDFNTQQQSLLRRYLIKNEIQHVLFQYGTTAKKGYKACVEAQVDYTVHFHGYDAYTLCYNKNYYKEVLRHAKNIVVVSKHMREQLVALGADEAKICVIPCGALVPRKIKKSENQKKNKNTYNLLAAGRLVEKKAPYLTILAFSQAARVEDRLRLKIAGTGGLIRICKDLITSLEVSDKVTLLGKVEHKKLIELIEDADCFIQHSKTAENGDKEGMPVAIMEALSLKTPVISTYHSGIPEIVKDGTNGLLSEERDVKKMSENIIKSIDYEFSFPEDERLKLKSSINSLERVING